MGGGVWEAGQLPVYFTTITVWYCVKVNKTVTTGAGEQQLWQQDTDWDVDRPYWPFALPAMAPSQS